MTLPYTKGLLPSGRCYRNVESKHRSGVVQIREVYELRGLFGTLSDKGRIRVHIENLNGAKHECKGTMTQDPQFTIEEKENGR